MNRNNKNAPQLWDKDGGEFRCGCGYASYVPVPELDGQRIHISDYEDTDDAIERYIRKTNFAMHRRRIKLLKTIFSWPFKCISARF